MTLGEALAMASAKDKQKWQHTAELAAYIANHGASPPKQPIHPDDLNPYTSRRRCHGLTPRQFMDQAPGIGTVKRGSPEHEALLNAGRTTG